MNFILLGVNVDDDLERFKVLNALPLTNIRNFLYKEVLTYNP
jgi:hypothetical protein